MKHNRMLNEKHLLPLFTFFITRQLLLSELQYPEIDFRLFLGQGGATE